MHDLARPNQYALLRERRFGPFFWTQFAGAANDNLFKFAFTVMVTYQLSVSWLPPSHAGLVIGALFILPFLLFSATAGQLADKWDKQRIFRLTKNLELLIMALVAWGMLAQNVPLLLACIFLMGTHSSLFGPAKFAYLPQVLSARELTGGNGMVEMGTFVAILLGNVAGGLLVAVPEVGHLQVAVAGLLLALLGRLSVQFIPAAPASDPGLRINWNLFSETWRNLQLAREQPLVFRSLLGISWMWFFGAVFLSQFPVFAKEVLHGNEQVAALLLVVFSVGVGTGALLCERLSRWQVEIGLVPLGALGMSLFAADLYLASRSLPVSSLMNLAAFIARPAHWRVLADLLLLSLSAGIYSVPMYALIQLRSQPTHRARIIAANNILNALFMVASSLIAGVLLSVGCSVPQIFLFTAVANLLVVLSVFLLVPEYLLRCAAWLASHLWRLKEQGVGQIPLLGPTLLVSENMRAIDVLLLIAISPGPVHCLLDTQLLARPVRGWLFRLAGALPLPASDASAQHQSELLAQAAELLRAGEMLALFPSVSSVADVGLEPLIALAKRERLALAVLPLALTRQPGLRPSAWPQARLSMGFSQDAATVSAQGLQCQLLGLRKRLAGVFTF